MHSFSDMAKLLNISTVNLSRLQKRFELPAFDGPGYSDAVQQRSIWPSR